MAALPPWPCPTKKNQVDLNYWHQWPDPLSQGCLQTSISYVSVNGPRNAILEAKRQVEVNSIWPRVPFDRKFTIKPVIPLQTTLWSQNILGKQNILFIFGITFIKNWTHRFWEAVAKQQSRSLACAKLWIQFPVTPAPHEPIILNRE